jgi:muramoyltetrapeptide carboxypeptidase
MKHFMKSSCFLAALCALLAFTACKEEKPAVIRITNEKVVVPPAKAPAFLKKGDKIALISPAYNTPDSNTYNTAKVLKEWGFEPVIGSNVSKLYMGKYSGTPEERAHDFIQAIRDTSIKAIICNRGGFGAMHLIDLINFDDVAKNPKWLVGFSEISTLHALEAKMGNMSIHGTMSSFIGKSAGRDAGSLLLKDMLLGKIPTYKIPANVLNKKGHAKGVLVGGNMASFTPLIGTPVDVYSRDSIILFIEELEETMRNVDRMFSSLELRGVMGNVKGVVMGDFTACDTDLEVDSAQAMLAERLKKYDIPIISGFPAGHGNENLPLIMGAEVEMDVTDSGATLSFHVDGEKQEIQTDDYISEANKARGQPSSANP